jgi:prephenate dehydratase
MPEPSIGFQGEHGAFSEEAVMMLFPGAEAVPHRTLRSVFRALRTGDVAFGVVPVENSLAGSINETYDLLGREEDSIVGEVVLAVDHALLALPGTRIEDVKLVASHPQALAQCDEYLAELDVELLPVYDTAGAAERIVREHRAGEAAVASERAASVYGLEILARRIQTNPQNYTRFVAIGREPQPLGPPDKTSFLVILGHSPGALFHALRPFAERDVNLSKLESRPLPGEPWRYRFYLDVDAGMDDPSLEEALKELRTETALVQVLGSYPRWRG